MTLTEKQKDEMRSKDKEYFDLDQMNKDHDNLLISDD